MYIYMYVYFSVQCTNTTEAQRENSAVEDGVSPQGLEKSSFSSSVYVCLFEQAAGIEGF